LRFGAQIHDFSRYFLPHLGQGYGQLIINIIKAAVIFNFFCKFVAGFIGLCGGCARDCAAVTGRAVNFDRIIKAPRVAAP